MSAVKIAPGRQRVLQVGEEWGKYPFTLQGEPPTLQSGTLETSKLLTCALALLIALAPSSARVFPAQGQPFCQLVVVSKGLIAPISVTITVHRPSGQKKGSCDFLQSENCPNSSFRLLSPEKSFATWGDEHHNDVSVQIFWPLSGPFFLQPGGQTLSCYHSCHALQLLGGQSCLLLHALWCEVTDTPRRGGSLGMYGRKLWRKTSKTPKPGQP